MKSSLPSLLALGLLAGGGVLLARQAVANAPASGGATAPALEWPEWGSSWDWSFDGSDGTADTTTPTTGGDMSAPRGIRNHNPGNIEWTGIVWQGLDDPPHDGRYLRFTAPRWGIRAMARVLDTYRSRHGLNTVAGIIGRWAPDHENPTNAYAEFVADHLGVGVHQPIDVLGRRPELIAAMVQFENGQQPYSLATITQGVALA